VKYFSKRTSSGAKLGSSVLYEYLVDNFWFKASNLERETINEPPRGDHKADIVIIGGGYTGPSSALNINRRIPKPSSTGLLFDSISGLEKRWSSFHRRRNFANVLR
jgi:hypothetical protein